MKNIRNILIGIIIGFLLSTTVFAAVQEYTLKQSECKIVVDGVEVKGELPLLIMDPGYNYIPAAEFRSICDKIGVGFEFDVPTKEIRITTKRQPEPLIESLEVEKMKVTTEKYVEAEYDGCKALIYNDKQYINSADYCKKFNFGIKADSRSTILINKDEKSLTIDIFNENKIILYQNSFYIELSVFEELTK